LPFLILLFSIIVFALVQAPPGDFLTSYIATLASSGSSMDQAQVDALKVQFGVDQPFMVQYGRWMSGLLRGDLGYSLEYQRPNSELIGERLLLTVALALFAFRHHVGDRDTSGHLLCHAPELHPGLFLHGHQLRGRGDAQLHAGPVLMWFAYDKLGISITGLFSPEFVQAPWSWARFVDLLKHIWVPAIVLGVAGTARLTRVMRANLLDELNKQYVITARAKGLVGVAARLEVSGAPGFQPADQHHRLVSAAAFLGQPDRGDGHESAQHRSTPCCALCSSRTCTWPAASCSSTAC
jgi:peptide/nickel transport system permease protein